jgi:hypothetical protein
VIEIELPPNHGRCDFVADLAGVSLAKGYQLGDTQGPRRYPHALELDIGPESVAVEAACAARTGLSHTHPHPKT